ncbi:MAG: hypothetical protein O9318_08755 [Hylemonella sp.]|uniref:hypothetical protein n=1 Tax=Hylemonella sp. TaxID=2066020 RepID=UPI0022BC5175|nr:hypothetical protein [Hylemonella sp.]MCZ8252544.1 hypothetical protein [Hylemonella sp.]
MRQDEAVWKFLTLFLVSALVASSALASSPQLLIETYLGKYDELSGRGYTVESGIGLDVKRKPVASAFSVCRPFSKAKSFDCVLVITEILGNDVSGRAKLATPSEMIHIQLPQGWDYFNTGDTECRSSKYPDAEIIAIGKWRDRKKPLHGGYVHSLKKAWRIDYKGLRFIEIPTQGVSCGFDDDRN